MKKILASVLSCVMLLGVLAACGNNDGGATDTGSTGTTDNATQTNEGGSGDKVEIRLLTRMAGTSTQVGIFQDVLDEFQEKYPEVTIVDDSQGDESAFNNILKTDLASGTLANIFRIQGVANLEKYIDEGYLLNVEPYLNDDAEWNQFVEGSINYYRVDGQDGVWAVPCEGGLVGVFWNERLFQEAGVDSFPETWDDLKDAVTKLNASGVTPISMGAKSSYMVGHLHNQIFYKWMGADATKELGNRTLDYTDPAVVETFGFVQELIDLGAFDAGAAGISDDVALTEFLNGNAAMIITGQWNIPRFRDEEECTEVEYINLAKFPYFAEKPEYKDHDMQVISPYMINGKLEGRELELTVELVKMLTSKETAERMANEAGQYIPRTDIALGDDLDDLFIASLDYCATSAGVAVDVFDYDPIASMQDRTRNSLVSLFTGATPEDVGAEIQAEIDNNG